MATDSKLDPSPVVTYWRIFVDVATVVWLAVFISSFIPSSPLNTASADKLGLGLLGVFVADLCVTYYRAHERPMAFVRHHWFDILLVIPYFRILRVIRVLRFARFLRLLQQPRAKAVLRVAKLALNGVKAVKKGKWAAREGAAVADQRQRRS